MEPILITEKIAKTELVRAAKEQFGTMVKIDVDVRREIATLGGEWHSEGDQLLSENGSSREDVWGINFYPWNPPASRIEYVSLINIKPSFGNRTMRVEDQNTREQIHTIVERLILRDDETL